MAVGEGYLVVSYGFGSRTALFLVLSLSLSLAFRS